MNNKNIPIFLSSDDNYAPLVATTICSLSENTSSYIDFYILDGGISEKNKELINSLKNTHKNFSIEFIYIDTNKFFNNIKVKNNLSLSAFNRLLIPQLKPEIKKAIYLDVDIIALGDIKELYKENLDNYIIGAVADNAASVEYYKRVKKVLDMDYDSIYFNSGVMLIDCEKWRRNVKFEDLLAIEKKYRDVRLYNDQDVLNKYFDKNYKILDKKYNVIFKNTNAILRHMADRIKPWNFSPDTDSKYYSNINDFWYYAKKTPFYKTFYSRIKSKEEQDILLKSIKIKRISKLDIYDIKILSSAISDCFDICSSINNPDEKEFKNQVNEYINQLHQMAALAFKCNNKKCKNYASGMIMKAYKFCKHKPILNQALKDYFPICSIEDFKKENIEEFAFEMQKFESLEKMLNYKRIENLRNRTRRDLVKNA